MNRNEKDSPAEGPKQQSEQISQKASPVPMTQEEVEAMAAGGAKAQAVAERLSTRSTEAAPQVVYPEEIAAIQESGKVPDSIRERIDRAEVNLSTEKTIEKKSPQEAPPEE